ncbi:uncharacterized protein LOC120289894 [Eucalyptus grandis]|uniref:uncharacterized protein LOC120289894 n=1 Tax=Eucalyptus grandis TaxID=71139 RepID=UPI00192EDB50|nr:uncharacterized protein LOC120289894 [Eucalyptus grandis]
MTLVDVKERGGGVENGSQEKWLLLFSVLVGDGPDLAQIPADRPAGGQRVGFRGSCSSLESSGLYDVMPVIRKRRRSSKRGNNSIKRPAARRHRKRKPCREEKMVYGSPDLGETPGPETLRWLCFSNRDDALRRTAEKPSMTPRVPGPAQRTSAVQDQAAPRGPVVASTVSVSG